MDSWRTCSLGDVLTLQRGFDLPVQERQIGPYPVIASTGPVGSHNAFQVKGPGVVIGRSGSIGGGQFLRAPFWPLNTTLWVKDFRDNDPRFCYYLLRSIDFGSFNVGSGVPTLNRNHVHPLPVTLPGVAEQRRISGFLGALDDKIELNRRMNETLEAMAQAIFRDWFVDFGPVRRKMEGATDPVAVMGGLAPDPARAADLAALFPDTLGNEGLPEGWATSSFGSEFRLVMGQSPPGDTYNDDRVGLPFFQGRTDFGFRYPEQRKHCSAPARIAEADDTLISVRAPVGDLNVAWERCCIGRGVAATRHKSGGTSFTFYALRSLQPELEQFEHTGTVFGAINKKQFEALKVLRPASSTVGAFERLVAPLDDMIRTKTAENRTLAETRDYLLPRLMSGAVRVASAEAAVTEAA